MCVKLFERMIVECLYYWMERENVLQRWQAGFQRLRGTEEQVLRLVQGIQDGWEERKPLSTIAVTRGGAGGESGICGAGDGGEVEPESGGETTLRDVQGCSAGSLSSDTVRRM